MEFADGNDDMPTSDYTLKFFSHKNKSDSEKFQFAYSKDPNLRGWPSLKAFIDGINKGIHPPPSSIHLWSCCPEEEARFAR